MARGAGSADPRFMRRALREAQRSRPSPNPRVGAVVVRDGKVIAVGHHEVCGGPHAEVNALAKAGDAARGATLYVTLEPCNHVGRTGPCTEAVIAAGIKRVVVGCADPMPHVPGGLDRMRKAGVEVELGVEQGAAEQLVRAFGHHRHTGLPHVLLKAALTLDGRMATRTGDSKWITGVEARTEAHRLRAESDAVLVGVGTALADDPELTVRMCAGSDPLRVVLDSQLRLPVKSKLVQGAGQVPTLVLHARGADERRAARLREHGVELAAVQAGKAGLSPKAVLRLLGKRGVLQLLLEGGPQVHGAFLAAGVVREAALFYAPKLLGDAAAMPLAQGAAVRRMADAFTLEDPQMTPLGPDWLIRGALRSKSSPTRSAEAGAAPFDKESHAK